MTIFFSPFLLGFPFLPCFAVTLKDFFRCIFSASRLLVFSSLIFCILFCFSLPWSFCFLAFLLCFSAFLASLLFSVSAFYAFVSFSNLFACAYPLSCFSVAFLLFLLFLLLCSFAASTFAFLLFPAFLSFPCLFLLYHPFPCFFASLLLVCCPSSAFLLP